ncbi:cupin domain-containing protein [Rouxiella sp. Mn2063]|uniref:cupin domain-containing protein n=1 Tax=Rouxiella sp. Mn2063 TaxID=3395262 RepID=UPI003BC86312
MLVNPDFSQRAIVTPAEHIWSGSPQHGVERIMLDRLGEEQAQATTIVRYLPHSFFPAHSHPQGEEILVLEGVFSEGEHHFNSGWYLRNPPGSSHQPSSGAAGAMIFVKLRQMSQYDDAVVRINTQDDANWQHYTTYSECPLYQSEDENVRLERRLPGDLLFKNELPQGAELLILAGSLSENNQSYERYSWLRLPAGDFPALIVGSEGVTLYIKTGHLRERNLPEVAL